MPPRLSIRRFFPEIRRPKGRLSFLFPALVVLTSFLALIAVIHDTPQSPSNVTLIIVSDSSAREVYQSQANSIACYAKRHRYSFVHLDPSHIAKSCHQNHEDFFFRKHCAVENWLASQPPSTVAIVLDGDNVGGTTNRSMQRWLDYDYDIAFYERSWNFEITAGNYIARNTKFTRKFLKLWASYEYVRPTGFSSSDNGAIHLATLDAIGVKGRHFCHDMYRNLTADVMNLQPYYDFVSCTRKLLGPPRTHFVTAPGNRVGRGVDGDVQSDTVTVGKLTVFPRFFGFSIDSKIYGIQLRRNLYPFHHEIKSPNWTHTYVEYPDEVGYSKESCKEFRKDGTIDDLEMGKMLEKFDQSMMFQRSGPHSVVPRWKQPDETCYQRMWCGPITGIVDEWPDGVITENGTVVKYEYKYPGVDWYNQFAAALI